MSYSCRHYSQFKLSLKKSPLLTKAALSGKIDKCLIVDATNCPQYFCDYYAQTSKAGLAGNGLPHGYGSGCIVVPESP